MFVCIKNVNNIGLTFDVYSAYDLDTFVAKGRPPRRDAGRVQSWLQGQGLHCRPPQAQVCQNASNACSRFQVRAQIQSLELSTASLRGPRFANTRPKTISGRGAGLGEGSGGGGVSSSVPLRLLPNLQRPVSSLLPLPLPSSLLDPPSSAGGRCAQRGL